jgi:hypothetical protein
MSARKNFDAPRVWRNRRGLPQDAQTGHPARPQRVKARGGTDRTSWGRSPIQRILANGKTPQAVPPSENLNRYVEGLNDARTLLAGFFSNPAARSGENRNDSSVQSRDRLPGYGEGPR